MTREEAKEVLIIKAGYGDFVENTIDQIFNDHETAIEILMKANEEEISRHFNECEKYEAQLKAKDERIKELEEDIKPKTCGKCKNFEFDQEFNDGYGQCFFGIHFPNSQSISYHKFDDGYCSLFEPKDNA